MGQLSTNFRETQSQLIDLYQVESGQQLKSYLYQVTKLVNHALRGRPHFSRLRYKPFQQAVVPLVFDQKRRTNGKLSKSERFHQTQAQKLITLLLEPDNAHLQGFLAEINDGLADKYNCESFDFGELLTENTAAELEDAIGEYADKQREKKKAELQAENTTNVDLLAEALEIIAEENQPDVESRQRDFDGTDGYLVGFSRSIRPNMARWTDLSDGQISTALANLEKQDRIARTGDNRQNKAIYLLAEPANRLLSQTEDDGSDSQRAQRFSMEEKCERLESALVQILRESGRESPQNHPDEVDSQSVTYVYIGRQDKITDDIELYAGLNSTQRNSAIRELRQTPRLKIEGGLRGKRAKFYLKLSALPADLQRLVEDDTQTETSTADAADKPAVQPEDVAETKPLQLGNLSAEDADELKARKQIITDKLASLESYQSGDIDAQIAELTERLSRLKKLREEAEKVDEETLRKNLKIIELSLELFETT